MRGNSPILTAMLLGMSTIFAKGSAAGDTSVNAGSEMGLSRLGYEHLDLGRPAVAPRALLPEWQAIKNRLAEQHHFTFSLAYSAL